MEVEGVAPAPKQSLIAWVRGISAGIDDMYEKKQFAAPGTQFMIFMTSMYLGIRGFMDYSQYMASSPLLINARVTSEAGGMIQSTARLPWSLKCVFAMLSDIQPIFYFKKRWYMLLATMAGSVAILLLAILPDATLAGSDSQGFLALGLLLIVNTMGSLDDCLTQGKYTEVIKIKGSGILVFRSTLMNAATTCVALYAGVILDINPRLLMWSALPWAVMACFPIAFNMMADERQEKLCATDCALVANMKSVFLLASVMGITVLINVGFAFTDFRVTRIIVTNACVFGLLGLSFKTIDVRIAKINVYLYICRLCTFGLSFQLTQFYNSPRDECTEEGINIPNFPFLVTSTFGGLSGAMAVFLGLYLFENYLVYWNAQKAFWVTTAFQVVAGCFDIMNTTRYNQTLLAWTPLADRTLTISGRTFRADDMATFLFGSMFLEPLIDQLDSLPATLLLSKLCPKGIETTMFAILAGYSNIGLSLSGQIGSFVLASFGFAFKAAEKDGDVVVIPGNCSMGGPDPANPESFHGLARTLLIGNIILPFITIPLTFCFIPNQPLDSEFLDDNEEDARELEVGEGTPGAPLTQGSRGYSFNPGASFDPDMLRHSRSEILATNGGVIM